MPQQVLPPFLIHIVLLACMLHNFQAAIDDTNLCPTNCSCSHPAASSLEIACPCRTDEAESLTEEINTLLAASGGQLINLDIGNTTLSRVPSQVCNLEGLTSLKLDRNRLTALPDDCLSRLKNLVDFSASYNSIAHLQVTVAYFLNEQKFLSFS